MVPSQGYGREKYIIVWIAFWTGPQTTQKPWCPLEFYELGFSLSSPSGGNQNMLPASMSQGNSITSATGGRRAKTAH
jgi:hypothetical protein